jgi:muramoyltetrapeptide carboxypeptidase
MKAGDKVGLVAPGRKITPEVIQRAQDIFQSWDLNLDLSPSLLRSEHSYHGALAPQRKDDFQNFLDDAKIKAVISARGGYGTTQFLDGLQWDEFKKNPKWVVGFSDVTALHLQLHRLGIESIHGIMPIQFDSAGQADSILLLKKLLFGEVSPMAWTVHPDNREGIAQGRLVGGNLSMVVDSLATSSELHPFGQVLFLEEVDEPLYKIDRMMTQLKRAKKLDKIKGLILGHFTDITDTSLPYGKNVVEIVTSKIEHPIPIAFGCPSGHAAPNHPWIHGASIALIVDKSGSKIEYQPDAVSGNIS